MPFVNSQQMTTTSRSSAMKGVPGTISTPLPNAFYCCNCGHGPWNCVLYAACIQCGHHFGPSHCTPTYLPEDNAEKPQALSKSPRADTVAALNIASIESDSAPSSPVARPRILGGEIMGITLDPSRPHANCETVPAPQDGESYWYCCSCSNGPNAVSLYAGCAMCNHKRCYNCNVETF
ncbi:uncharacterized protein K452DRAFT_80435 [Aplosporella prunicola CBS 121167]|uniref:Uncharacterized protein n=1 Tax=Aplosporella prunicola CBS 121167 TaxID=1176127 RepID=A0A6A6B5E7_9PEZI|nr:uncharacterized protein K452DRAFT_80435 [Aplosporella prunicola CBS 121167]KAF2139066.1 hypothetical protein K452DRAFT_80435 [Aplosporella prunicola CBS 121167]